jgi:hypothetical protein
MTVLSQYPTNLQNLTTNPNEAGQVGFIGGKVYGAIDAARRTFAPTASRWADQVSQIPANWTVQSDGTVTRNNSATGPDGSSFAMDISQTGGTFTPNVFFSEGNITYSVGDYVIAGAWYKSVPGGVQGGYPFNLQLLNSCVTTPIYGMNGVSLTGTPPNFAGEWKWAAGAFRVTTGGTCQTNFGGQYNTTTEMFYFAPVLLHIPAGQITDAEAAELAANLEPYPDSLSSPVEATLRGHPFAFGGSGDSYFATLDHTGLTANQTYTFPNASGTLALVYRYGVDGGTTAVPANSCMGEGSNTGATGVAAGMLAVGSPEAALPSGIIGYIYVSGANTLQLTYCNVTTSPITPTAITWSGVEIYP